MEIVGEYDLSVDRATVWRALNDPEVLRVCIPGCEELARISETEFTARVKSRVGPVSAKFSGRVVLEDVVAPESYTLRGEGEGGVAGFAKGHAAVRLEETPSGTVLRYDAEAQVGGKLAQLGSRVLKGTVRKLTARFFDNFAASLGGSAVGLGEEADQ